MDPQFDFNTLQHAPGQSLQTHMAQLEKSFHTQSLLRVKPAKAWLKAASQRPAPKMLFSELWFEGELCILFADTNAGKSILAVQIADSITRGMPIPGFAMEAQAQKVLYVDFELSDKQFEARYSRAFQDHYPFEESFLRAELTLGAGLGEMRAEHDLQRALERALNESGAKVLIIDNLTYLCQETERAQYALPLMKQLRTLQRQHHLSILTLAHTPKREVARPLTRNDLQGSKMLINFCDNAFVIGESQQGPAVRYLKQLKARNTALKYHSKNVCLCRLTKPGSFVHFEWIGFATEREHLQQQRQQEVKALKEAGLTNVEIARRLSVSEASVRRWLQKLP